MVQKEMLTFCIILSEIDKVLCGLIKRTDDAKVKFI